MAVYTFVIDHVVALTGDLVPVYYRGDDLYLKLNDVPKEYYQGLKKFITNYPDDPLKPEWENGALCMHPYEFLFLVGGTYRGTLNRYMYRLSDLRHHIGQ